MMSMNLAILELAKRQRLAPNAYAALLRLARAANSPPVTTAILRRGVQVLAMLLLGLGVIFFIAANWLTQSPLPMFAGLQTALLGACVGAARWPRLRVPLALLGFLATGALMAFFGQYYQSGADPWQMFALWAGLLIPLAFASRSDIIWSAWAIIAMTAISLWLKGFTGSFGFRSGILHAQIVATLLAFGLCALLSRPLQRFTGAGDWALNLAILFTVILASTCGLWALFSRDPSFYPMVLIALCGAVAYFAQARAFDIRVLSMCALGIDALVIGGSIKMVSNSDSFLAIMFIVGLTILIMLHVTVSAIVGMHRRHAPKE